MITLTDSEYDKLIDKLATLRAKLKRAEAVVEAARNMMKCDPSLLNNSLGSAYAIKHYCEVKETLRAYDEGGNP